METIHAQLLTVDPAASVGAAFAALEAQRAALPYATTAGIPCSLPQLYEALSARDGLAKRQRTAVPGDAAPADGAAAPA